MVISSKVRKAPFALALVAVALAVAALAAMPFGAGNGQSAPANATGSQQALSVFQRDYGLFGSAPSMTVSYGVHLNAGVYGLLLSLFRPQLVLYKLGGAAMATISINMVFQSVSASFYEVNGTTIYCLGSSTWFSSSVASCGLVGNLTRYGITIASLNLSSQDFTNVSYVGVEAVNGRQCDEFSGLYTGSLLQGLLSRAGLQSGGSTVFDFCMDRQYGYVEQLNGSISNYTLTLTATNVSTAPIDRSQFAMPVSFVADWASCSGSGLGFYYVPGSTVSGPSMSIAPKTDPTAALATRTLPGTYDAYGMYYLNFTASQQLYSGENLTVCTGGACDVLQCT